MIPSQPTSLPGSYRPLGSVLTADDFDTGMNGWLDLRPNFVGPDFAAHSHEIDLEHWGPVMLSSATFAFSGTHGSASGTYSLKLTSRSPAAPPEQPPASGSMSLAIKRLAVPRDAVRIRVEAVVAYTTEQDRPGLGVDAMRAFGMFVDLQDDECRYMPGVRYVNTAGGEPVRRWQYFDRTTSTDAEWSYGVDGWHRAGIDPQWYGERRPDGSTSGTAWFGDGAQGLIYNETDDKVNWMPVALEIDLRTRTYVAFEANGRAFTFPAGAGPTQASTYRNIDRLLNPVFFVEADGDRRVSLFVDSVVVSYTTGADELEHAGEPDESLPHRRDGSAPAFHGHDRDVPDRVRLGRRSRVLRRRRTGHRREDLAPRPDQPRRPALARRGHRAPPRRHARRLRARPPLRRLPAARRHHRRCRGSRSRPHRPRRTEGMTPVPKTITRATIASTVGTALEWYDFTLYSTAAALVLPAVFFPSGNTASGLLASFATFAVGFVARPIGGVIIGNLGDRFGRRGMLFLTLLLMAGSSTAIGLLPSYAAAGVVAPLLLVVLRVVQGFGAGGEYAGATLLAAEHADTEVRGLNASIPAVGNAAGSLLATGVFALTAALTGSAFTEWGWRIPFLISIAVGVAGFIIRFSVAESPEFTRSEEHGPTPRVPIRELFRSARSRIPFAMLASIGPNVASYLPNVYALSYLTTTVGAPTWVGLTGIIIGNALKFITIPTAGRIADRIGRRPVFLAGAIGTGVLAFPFFFLLDSGTPILIWLAIVLVFTLCNDAMLAAQSAFMSELFDVRLRYTGVTFTREIPGAVIGGTLPFVAAALTTLAGGTWLVSLYTLVLAAAAAAGMALLPETLRVSQGRGGAPWQSRTMAGEHGQRSRPRLVDVASAARVSPALASRVLRGDDTVRVAEDTRARVRRVADELGYVPNAAARHLRTRRTGLIGVVVHDLSSPIYTQVFAGAREAAERRDYLTVLGDADELLTSPATFRAFVSERRVDGLVVQAGHSTFDARVPEIAEQIPIVVFNAPVDATDGGPTAPSVPSVYPDEVAAAELLTEHLLARGHRRIGFVSGPADSVTTRLRLDGVHAALAAAGVSTDVVCRFGDWTAMSGRAEADALLLAPEPPTAIVAANTLIGAGAIASAAANGLRVPDDVAVAAIHDAWIADVLVPSLTTVALPLREVGSRAVTLLLDGGPGTTLVSDPAPRLVPRAST
ncbi:MFS transporter [Curtobacterium flaccumfaciens]|nr:MFS transporter [Curtobacterium flaccumfaciens]